MNLPQFFALAACCFASSLHVAVAQGASMQPAPTQQVRDIRFVVFHRPGPAWLPGKTLFDQPVIREHVEHYRKLLTAGKLAMGGPHLDDKGGGMMISSFGVTEQELREFAGADPAVKSGVLTFEVRAWLIGMSQSQKQ